MARNLNWFQARALAKQGTAVRRESWRHWLTYKRNSYLWFIHSEGSAATSTEPKINPVPSHVALATEFGKDEFLAADWTDEHWIKPPNGGNPDPGTPPPAGDPVNPGTGGTGGPGSGGGNVGGGWGGGGNPTGPNGDDGHGPGGGNGPGGGGGQGNGGNDGDNDGNQDEEPPAFNYTPVVEVTLAAPVDGPGCFISPPKEGQVLVNVTLPNPAGGPLKVATLSVSCGAAGSQLGTLGPGAQQGFRFRLPVAPGNEVTVTATASDGKHTWVGRGSDKWEPWCLKPSFIWSGVRTTNHSCPPDPNSPYPEDPTGYEKEEVYATGGAYAINPEPPGQKGGMLIANGNEEENQVTTLKELPNGTTTTTKSYVPPPGGITCTVGEDGSITNVQPARLNIYVENETINEGGCTTVIASSEDGP